MIVRAAAWLLPCCACSGLLIVNMHDCTYICRSMRPLRARARRMQVCNLRKHVVRFLLRRRQFDFIISVRTLTQRLNFPCERGRNLWRSTLRRTYFCVGQICAAPMIITDVIGIYCELKFDTLSHQITDYMAYQLKRLPPGRSCGMQKPFTK